MLRFAAKRPYGLRRCEVGSSLISARRRNEWVWGCRPRKPCL